LRWHLLEFSVIGLEDEVTAVCFISVYKNESIDITKVS
jgi:hypothetical protein